MAVCTRCDDRREFRQVYHGGTATIDCDSCPRCEGCRRLIATFPESVRKLMLRSTIDDNGDSMLWFCSVGCLCCWTVRQGRMTHARDILNELCWIFTGWCEDGDLLGRPEVTEALAVQIENFAAATAREARSAIDDRDGVEGTG